MIVDTSVVMAVLFDEPDARWAAAVMNEHAAALRMSTVNLAEALVGIRDRQPQLSEAVEARLLESSIRFVAPDIEQARLGLTWFGGLVASDVRVGRGLCG